MIDLPPAPIAIQPPAANACDPQPFRWMDLCPAPPGDAGPAAKLKHLELGDPAVWVTFGGEVRYRVENVGHPDFGLRKAEDYAASDTRAYAEADLRTTAGPRAFVQLSIAEDQGRKPARRPFDQSEVDLAQAFVDLPAKIGPVQATLRVGRQELNLGPNRLVSNRDAANLRRAFDMALVDLAWGPAKLTVFSGRPILNRPGAFDDKGDPAERFSGADGKLAGRDPRFGSWTLDLFGFERTRSGAVFQSGSGPERRDTLGVRAADAVGPWDVALQAAHQGGRFAGQPIDAYGLSAEIGYRWRTTWGQPRLGLITGRASGDRNPADGKLQSFDPVYPNLSYFTDAPVFYPGNTWDVQVNASLNPVAPLTLQAGADAIWRLSLRDALYAPPGIPLLVGTGTGGHDVATLLFAKATWRASARWDVSASLVHGVLGSAFDGRAARAPDYALAQITYRL